MTNLILAGTLFGICMAPIVDRNEYTGYFSRYNERPTISTIAYRQSVGDLPLDLSRYDGVIAVADCMNIGNDAWIYINGQWHTMIVFDCSGHIETSIWMEQNNILGELGYHFAEEMGLLGVGGISGRLSYDPPIESTCIQGE